jgi:tRNA 2-thiouridine synthesizing protein A
MEGELANGPVTTGIPGPEAMVDAGDEAWETLKGIVSEIMSQLAVGEILEIVSGTPDLREALPAWCAATGHHVLGTREEGEKTSYWLLTGERTCDPSPGSPANRHGV